MRIKVRLANMIGRGGIERKGGKGGGGFYSADHPGCKVVRYLFDHGL